jgi:hypothetical protein
LLLLKLLPSINESKVTVSRPLVQTFCVPSAGSTEATLGRWRQQVSELQPVVIGLPAAQSLLLLQPQQSPRSAPPQGPIFFTQVKFGLGLVLPWFKRAHRSLLGSQQQKPQEVSPAPESKQENGLPQTPKAQEPFAAFAPQLLPKSEEPPPH